MLAKPFYATSQIFKATDHDPDDPEAEWYFHAPPALMDKKDYDGQTLVKAGVLNGLKMWEHLGSQFDYAHQYRKTLRPSFLIAKGVGTTEHEGTPIVIGKLFNDKDKPLAREVQAHIRAGGNMGLSIEGLVKALDGKDKLRVLDTEIHFITIDPTPKGFDGTRLRPGKPVGYQSILKSLSAELESGDVGEWADVDDDMELVPMYSSDFDPYSIMSPGQFLKALVAGGGGGHGPGETGLAATVREEFLRKRKPSGRRVPQCRCKGCGKSQSIKRQRCIECGCSMKAKA